ncbi:nicolin-1-like isoform X1 [Branchiostoma lanceolatum]|uniref:nicolin-1-like isoform X1 n=1 Tax=Branchiostoma lanceolatum TaxID=7740 RepID=UPI0034558028
MTGKPLVCSIRNPHPITIGDPRAEFSSGCAVVDLTFPSTKSVDIGEITFKNNYTALLSIKLKVREENEKEGEEPAETDGETTLTWVTGLKNVQLMPEPHCEDRAQSYFRIKREQLLVPPDNVLSVRLVLQQPSPVWLSFGLDDIKFYSPKDETSELMLSELVNGDMPADDEAMNNIRTRVKENKDIPPVEEISSSLQQMWALSETARINQTEASLGRFDRGEGEWYAEDGSKIDGSYDINLLSYT